METIELRPRQPKHVIINHKKVGNSESVLIELDNKERIQIFTPECEECYKNRRKIYDMPKATDVEMREVIIAEHKARMAGEKHTLEEFKQVLEAEELLPPPKGEV